MLTLNTKIRLNKTWRVRRYLTFVESFVSFISVGNVKPPIIWVLKINTKSGIATVCVRTNG